MNVLCYGLSYYLKTFYKVNRFHLQINYILLNSSSEAQHVTEPTVLYHAHKIPALVPILSQISSVHTAPSYVLKINFNIILQTTSLSFWLSEQNPLHISLLPHECYISCQKEKIILQRGKYTYENNLSARNIF
jgi:hypothetical protein